MVTWVIQSNLSKSGSEQLFEACQTLGIPSRKIEVQPFDPEPPTLDMEGSVIFYGATNFITTIHRSRKWSPGAFFDEQTFRISEYLKHWRMLNEEAELTTLREFGQRNIDPDELFFVRPDRDLKEFAGEVIRFGNFSEWQQKITAGDYLLEPDCPIIVAPPVGIADEWRLFIVDGKAVTGSHYRSYHFLTVFAEVPQEVIDFAEEMAKKWSPSPVFVLDVGRSGPHLYVIEANCINSSGFYAADVVKLVKEVTNFIER